MHHTLPLSAVSVSNNDGRSLFHPVIAGGSVVNGRSGDGDARNSTMLSKRVTSFLLIILSVVTVSLTVTWSKSSHNSMRSLRNNWKYSSIVFDQLSLDRSLQEISNNDGVYDNRSDVCTLEYCTQNYEQQICATETNWITAVPVSIQIILTIILLALSALFSGLTLGLMSLDITGLEIVMAGDDPKQAQYAKDIYPVRKHGNLLLCTLLLGNVAVNSLVSIFLATFAGGTVGFLTSTILILLFGEMLPQALVRVVYTEGKKSVVFASRATHKSL
jgi:hypothetical protein